MILGSAKNILKTRKLLKTYAYEKNLHPYTVFPVSYSGSSVS